MQACAPGAMVVPGPGLEEVSDAVLAATEASGTPLGERRRLLGKYLGSYHHAAGLNRALERVATRYALVIDPDFYVVRPGWIAEVLAHVRAEDLAAFGAPWNPRWYQKFRYFPCTHFMVLDLAKRPWSPGLLAPDLVRGGRRFASRQWTAYAAARAASARRRWGVCCAIPSAPSPTTSGKGAASAARATPAMP